MFLKQGGDRDTEEKGKNRGESDDKMNSVVPQKCASSTQGV